VAQAYYIFRSGRLRRRQNTLYLEPPDPQEPPDPEDDPEGDAGPAPDEADQPNPDGAGRKIIPVEDVSELYLFGEVSLNTKLLNFLGRLQIPVHVFNYHGFYTGSFYPREGNVSGEVLIRQVQHSTDPARRLAIARELVQGAYQNLHRNLAYYRNRGRPVEDAIAAMEAEAAGIERAPDIGALMGIEGRIRNSYYQAFNEILRLETPFAGRVKRPPDNLVNALLSFGNSLLYAAVLSQIYWTPLNPTVSFLHAPGSRRFSLALDISEIFKPLIVDKLVFRLINTGMISEKHLFARVNYAYLDETGRKLVVREFEERLRTTVRHRRLGRNVSYRGLIRIECYKLVKHLLGIEPYRALRAWW